MSWWSSLFESEDAVWMSARPTDETIATVASMYTGLSYRKRLQGSELLVQPRGRSGPLYTVTVRSGGLSNPRRLDSHIELRSKGLLKAVIYGAVVAFVASLLVLAGVDRGVNLLFVPLNPSFIAFFATLYAIWAFAQLLLMGRVRATASRRLAQRMYSAGATPMPPAGWYPDPSDRARQRWWDGNAWSAVSENR